MMKTTLAVAGCSVAVLVAWLVTGCDDDPELALPPEGGAGGSAGAGGAGGSGGAAVPGRGDPNDFPATCWETCEEACGQLASCGGDASPYYPLEQEDCLQRCDTSEGGHYWPDISDHFKCCTSQPDCENASLCGGWLKHPDVAASCERYCECIFRHAIAELTAGREPPPGYRFAPDTLLIDPGQASLSLSLISGAREVRGGKRKLVRLDPTATAATVAELQLAGRVLPTFVDAAGRFSAAMGDLVLIVEQPQALSKALPIAKRYGLGSERPLKTRLRSQPTARLYLLKGSDAWRTLDARAEIAKLPGVRAELDQLRFYERRYTPNDPMYADQWHLRNVGQNGSTVSVDGRVSEAWDVTRGKPQVTIAINDDGVDLNHPEFAGKLEPAMNYPPDWQVQVASGDFGGHGTPVAGVAAARADNAAGGAGVCPGCRVLAHLLGESTGQGFQVTDAQIAAGFTNMVDAGAWVINNSWGPVTGDPVYAIDYGPIPPLAAVVQASFDYAETVGRGGLGTVIVFAAGNANDVIDPVTGYVTNICVGAVDDLGLKAYYSSLGPENDIAAPTSGGLNGITTAAIDSQYTASFGGTSSAAPFVAGVAGLILSADLSLYAHEVRDILTATATKIDPVFGKWDQDDRSVYHGAGLVNAYAAVQLAAGGCATAADCIAPSDDCGAGCGTLGQCAICRTHADCAADHVCQALPSLGQLVCVAAKGSGDCPNGTAEVNGHCLPSPATCGFCTTDELCNGRDDNCDGQVDEDGVCQDGPLCFIDAPGCAAGTYCAGRRCRTTCTSDAGCSNNQSCEAFKDQYGDVAGPRGCATSFGGDPGGCATRCEVRASYLEDEQLAEFVECMEDGEADCDKRPTCRELLPSL